MSSNRFAFNQFLFKCPYLKNIDDCPFDELRKLAFEERIKTLKSMTFQQLNNLEIRHKSCQKLFENK